MKIFNEKNLPRSLSVIISILYLLVMSFFPKYQMSNPTFNVLLNISMVISSISLGFLGAMIGALLSLTNSSIMHHLCINKLDATLIRYMKRSAYTNFLILFSSCLLLLSNLITVFHAYSYFLVTIWLFLFSLSFTHSAQIIFLLFNILQTTMKITKDQIISADVLYTPKKIPNDQP